MQRFSGAKRVGALEEGVGATQAPVESWVHRESAGVRIQVAAAVVEIVAVLVRLPAVEQRPLDLHRVAEEAGGEDAKRDVGGILPVVRQGRQRVTRGGWTMGKGHRPDRGLAHGRHVKRDRQITSDGALVQRGELHEEIVGVLPIVQRLSFVGFP